jgi:hypothetical protein
MSPKKQPVQPEGGHDTIVVDLSSVEGSPEGHTAANATNATQTHRHPKSKKSSTLVIPSSRGSTIPAQIFPLTRRTAERARQARLDKSALLRRLENAQMEEDLRRPLPQPLPDSDLASSASEPRPQSSRQAPPRVFPPPHPRGDTPTPALTLRVTTLDALPPSPVMSLTALASEEEIEEDHMADDDHPEEQQDEFDEYNNAISGDEDMLMDESPVNAQPPAHGEYRLPAPPATASRRTGQPSPSPAPRERAANSTTRVGDKPSRGTGLPEPTTPAGNPNMATDLGTTQPTTAQRLTAADKGKGPARTGPTNDAFARIRQNAKELRERSEKASVADFLARSDTRNVHRNKGATGPEPENRRTDGFMREPQGGWERIARNSSYWWARRLATEDRTEWETIGETRNGIIVTPFNAVTSVSDEEVILGPLQAVQTALVELLRGQKIKVKYARTPPSDDGLDTRRSECLIAYDTTDENKAQILKSAMYCHSRVAFSVQEAKYIVNDFIGILYTVIDDGSNPDDTAAAMLEMVKHHLCADGMVEHTLAAICESIVSSVAEEDLEYEVWTKHEAFLDSLAVKPILLVRATLITRVCT